jgi:hypothetical protein
MVGVQGRQRVESTLLRGIRQLRASALARLWSKVALSVEETMRQQNRVIPEEYIPSLSTRTIRSSNLGLTFPSTRIVSPISGSGKDGSHSGVSVGVTGRLGGALVPFA